MPSVGGGLPAIERILVGENPRSGIANWGNLPNDRPMHTPVEIAGERLELFASRAAFWPAGDGGGGVLFVADTHFGKAASFRAAGVPVPEQTTGVDLERLGGLLTQTGAAHLVVLGDLLHARSGRTPDVFNALDTWRAAHASTRITLVRGNHDASAGDPPATLDITCVDAGLRAGPFRLVHEPSESDDAYTLAGHVHPGHRISGRGKGGGGGATLACFHLGRRLGVLPAFGVFTGLGRVRRSTHDRVFVITPEGVLEAPSTKR